MFFARENKKKQKQTKNDTSNQNRVRLFFRREWNDASDKKPEMCEFRTKIPAFYRRLWLAAPLFGSYFADIQGEKIFS